MATNRSRWPFVILGIALGSILTVALLVGGLLIWGWSLYSAEVRDAMNRNPVILEHLGEVQRFQIDWVASGQHPSPDVFVLKATGATTSGVVTAELLTDDEGREFIASGTLALPDGRTFELAPDPPDDVDDDEDDDDDE